MMADPLLDSAPARTLKADVTVMLQRTRDELPAIQELAAAAASDPGRPQVEYYRRHDEIELWVPVTPPA